MSFFSNLFKRNSFSQQGQPQVQGQQQQQAPMQQQQQQMPFQQQVQGAPHPRSSLSNSNSNSYAPRTSVSKSPNQLPVIHLTGQYDEAEGFAVPSVGANGVWINMILDESGSMQSVTDPTIENFNKYINEQKILQVKEQAVNSNILSAVQEVDESTLSNSTVSAAAAASPSPDAPTPAGGPSAESESKEPAAIQFNEKDECVVSLVKFDSPSIYSVYERTPLDQVPSLSRDTYRPNGGTNLLDAIGAVIQRVDAHLNAQSDVALRPGVLVVIMTDGQENSSRHFSSPVIKRMISARQAAGWTFVFLGANIDAWSAAESVGIAQQNAFNFSVHKQENLSSALADSTARYRGQMKVKKAMMMGKSRAVQESMNSAWNSKQCEQQFFEDSERALEESS